MWALGKGQTASLTLSESPPSTQGCLLLPHPIHQPVSGCLLTAYCVVGVGLGPPSSLMEAGKGCSRARRRGEALREPCLH